MGSALSVSFIRQPRARAVRLLSACPPLCWCAGAMCHLLLRPAPQTHDPSSLPLLPCSDFREDAGNVVMFASCFLKGAVVSVFHQVLELELDSDDTSWQQIEATLHCIRKAAPFFLPEDESIGALLQLMQSLPEQPEVCTAGRMRSSFPSLSERQGFIAHGTCFHSSHAVGELCRVATVFRAPDRQRCVACFWSSSALAEAQAGVVAGCSDLGAATTELRRLSGRCLIFVKWLSAHHLHSTWFPEYS